MAQVSEAKLFEWLGRLYAERCSISEERDEARTVSARLVEQLQAAQQPNEKGAKKRA